MAQQKAYNTDSTPYAANIPRYYLYTVLFGFAFGFPAAVWVLYLQQRRGLTLTEVTIADIAFWITITLSELPTGMVADALGRKTSIAIGMALLSVSVLAWGVVSTVPLLIFVYVIQAVGFTFRNGAQDAFLYESLRATGRIEDYTKITGRAGAIGLGATALGCVLSGLLGAIDLTWPIFAAGFIFLLTLGVVLTFKEPVTDRQRGQTRPSYRKIVEDSLVLIRAHTTLRYALFYLTVVPTVSMIIELVFVQPQAVALGVPIAAIGVVVMALQVMGMVGSGWADRIGKRFGERQVISLAPLLVMLSLVLLALFQTLPALFFIAVSSFSAAVIRPLVLTAIQNEISDEVRATVLSMQSLMYAALVTVGEPLLGSIADRSGLPAVYVVLAGALGVYMVALFWRGRAHFPRQVVAA